MIIILTINEYANIEDRFKILEHNKNRVNVNDTDKIVLAE